MSLFIVAIALSCIIYVDACMQLGFGEGAGNNWQTVTVKYSPPALRASDPYAFNKMPLTRDEAKSQGWTLVEKNEQYKGDRYIDKNNEVSAMTIYDPDTGRLIGMQTEFLANEIHPDWVDWFENSDMFSTEICSGELYYAFTAYTVDPDKVKSSQCENAVGCDLYFLKKDSTLWKIPNKPSEMKSSDFWVEGNCVDGMRKYFWNISENMDCKSYEPFFLMYLEGNLKLSGYGVDAFGKFSSPRMEPLDRAPSVFFKTVPKCIPIAGAQAGGLTTLHIYFKDGAKDLKCD